MTITCYSGCYLSTMVYHDNKMLLTFDDCLPTFMIDENISSLNKVSTSRFYKKIKYSYINV